MLSWIGDRIVGDIIIRLISQCANHVQRRVSQSLQVETRQKQSSALTIFTCQSKKYVHLIAYCRVDSMKCTSTAALISMFKFNLAPENSCWVGFSFICFFFFSFFSFSFLLSHNIYLSLMPLNFSFCLHFVFCYLLSYSFSFVSWYNKFSRLHSAYNCVIHFVSFPYVLVVVPRILVYDVYEVGEFFNLFVVVFAFSFFLSFHFRSVSIFCLLHSYPVWRLPFLLCAYMDGVSDSINHIS